MGLPDNFRKGGLLAAFAQVPFVRPKGRAAILAGSCSTATRGQIKFAIANGIPSLRLHPEMIAEGKQSTDSVVHWATAQDEKRPILIYSSAEAGDVLEAQEKLGCRKSRRNGRGRTCVDSISLISHGFTQLLDCRRRNVRRCGQCLKLRALMIGPEIDPGVPWTRSINGPELAIALKSGNFGAENFFIKAWEIDT